MILVDAGPIVALLGRPARQHAGCFTALQRLREPLCTVWPAVTEAMFLLADRPDAQAALADKLESAAISLLPLDRRDMPRVRELMAKYHDLPMDFTDATLVRVAERDGLDTIFTTDRRDFSAYRLLGRRRFRVVP
jgi:predicted nucleic acid-binding protein